MLKIAVFIKQVPAAGKISLDENHTLIRDEVEKMINPPDLNALEAALQLRDEHGGTVTVCTMGPLSAESILRNTAAMGADRLCLITDRLFAGSDTFITAKILTKSVLFLGGFDLIFCGRRSLDGETGQVGPELAALLGIPCLTNCVEVKKEQETLICRRLLENEYQTWRVVYPAVLTVYNGVNSPRLPSISGYRRSKSIPIEEIDAAMLNLSASECGLAASPTRVIKTTKKSFGKRNPARFTGLEGINAACDLIQNIQTLGQTNGE